MKALRNFKAAQCFLVAQVGNLPYRRLAVGWASEAGGPADYQSVHPPQYCYGGRAIQQTDCPRYFGCGWPRQVILLSDGETVHNVFFDRTFKP